MDIGFGSNGGGLHGPGMRCDKLAQVELGRLVAYVHVPPSGRVTTLQYPSLLGIIDVFERYMSVTKRYTSVTNRGKW
jgi:hypothetical protein